MENLQISGKTVEEATKKALAELGVGLDEVEITVLNQGRGGILGLGAEDARISVSLRQSEKNEENRVIEVAKDILENILSRMGIQGTIKIENSPLATDENGETDSTIFNIVGDDLGMLIGRRGQTLDALQYLVRLITSKQTQTRAPLIIDVESYKLRRYDDLRTLALNVAAQVKARKTSFRLEPMSAFERRIIHITLANNPDVVTESMGEGEARKVVISPQQKR